MMKKHFLRAISITLCAASLLTGCGGSTIRSAKDLPLAQPLTQAQIIDYYAASLNYDTVISRDIDVHKAEYETMDIEGKKADTLKELASKCEKILGSNSYVLSSDSVNLVSRDTFGYIKGILDNEVLTKGEVQNITGALGYYFVDIEYTLSKKSEGTFKPNANIIGLNGAFLLDHNDQVYLDKGYMTVLVNKLNEYFVQNNILQYATFNGSDTLTISGTPNVRTSNNSYGTSGNLDTLLGNNENNADTTETETDTTDSIDTESTDTEINDTETEVSKPETNNGSTNKESYTIVTPLSRRITLNTSLINKVVGSSMTMRAIMPSLETIYNIPNNEGTISGYGIYTAGGNGLKIFGFNRNQLAGKVTLRYVFKDASDGSGKIHGVNIYCISEEITNGITISENNVLVPEFLMTELKKTIERADRAIMNHDLSAMMSGNIYEDMGFGVLRGYKESNTGIEKHMSTIRQVIARDTANNAYLLEVETTTIEGAKDVDRYGTYRDKSYVVIQQQNDKFVIIDWIRVLREMVSEPAIDPDSNVKKRLVALNLAGEISDDNKKSIKKLISALYTAGSNRILHGPYEVNTKDGKVTIEKGMYDCFSSDKMILSKEDLEYMNSSLRGILTMKGTNVSAKHKGTITEWIGGYENQAEFTTEELVLYATGTGYYMQVYYLASYENDEWVIAERTVLDEYEVKDADKLNNIKERVGL